jgi:hypothetical protein
MAGTTKRVVMPQLGESVHEGTISKFQRELGEMGYKFQFITLAGFHALNHSMFELAHGYAEEGMPAYVRLQDAEFAAEAAEAAAAQDRFWEMHELLFRRQKALEDGDLQRYAAQFDLGVPRFDRDRFSTDVLARIRRDVESGMASGEVRGTPTLFIDGVVHLGGFDAATLTETVSRR